jgi:hypothetical protein
LVADHGHFPLYCNFKTFRGRKLQDCKNVLIFVLLSKNMQCKHYIPILGTLPVLVLFILLASMASADTNEPSPKITELKIPHLLNLTLDDHNTTANLLNISYVYKGKEYYFLFNVTHISLADANTANCIDKASATGEKNYVCVPDNPNDFSINTLFCNTNTDDCVQPSGRHKN